MAAAGARLVVRPAESNTFITFRIIIFSVDLDGRYSQRAEDIYAPIAESRRVPRRRGRRNARSLARHPFLFGGGFQPPTHKTSNQAGAGAGAGGSQRRARDIIIKSVCKVGCARFLPLSLSRSGPMPETCHIVCTPSLYLHGRQVDKSSRLPCSPGE